MNKRRESVSSKLNGKVDIRAMADRLIVEADSESSSDHEELSANTLSSIDKENLSQMLLLQESSGRSALGTSLVKSNPSSDPSEYQRQGPAVHKREGVRFTGVEQTTPAVMHFDDENADALRSVRTVENDGLDDELDSKVSDFRDFNCKQINIQIINESVHSS